MLLGLVQGPAELLPVSSSGHLILLGSRDKGLEVFLHAGTAAALLVGLRGEVREVFSALDGGRVLRIGLTLAPAAVCGLAFERVIEERLGGPRTVALAQIAGGVGLVVADRAPAWRPHSDASARDALWVGIAQALALVPGVSRNGATLSAARLLGFRRDAASRMSRHAALPVIAGATALKLVRGRGEGPTARLLRGGSGGGPSARPLRGRHVGGAAPPLSPGTSPTPQYAAGAAAAFVSSLAAARLVPRIDRLRSYAPFGLYRIGLGLFASVLLKCPPGALRQDGSGSSA